MMRVQCIVVTQMFLDSATPQRTDPVDPFQKDFVFLPSRSQYLFDILCKDEKRFLPS